ncbi:hypothetical protein JOL62DRAFT_576545 [Phyllosticta paracitricarpa]|uniref:Uncharacterized protein n=1 Tax=Phyllosticta paracitricarpa TaxID=2016321 RepID=A0ABR1N4M7_9PEZI
MLGVFAVLIFISLHVSKILLHVVSIVILVQTRHLVVVVLGPLDVVLIVFFVSLRILVVPHIIIRVFITLRVRD